MLSWGARNESIWLDALWARQSKYYRACHFLEWHATKTTSSLHNSARRGNVRSLQKYSCRVRGVPNTKHLPPPTCLNVFPLFARWNRFSGSILNAGVWLMFHLPCRRLKKDWWCWSCQYPLVLQIEIETDQNPVLWLNKYGAIFGEM